MSRYYCYVCCSITSCFQLEVFLISSKDIYATLTTFEYKVINKENFKISYKFHLVSSFINRYYNNASQFGNNFVINFG